MVQCLKKYLVLCFLFSSMFINAQQIVDKPENVLQQVVNKPLAFYEISKYPSAMDIFALLEKGGKAKFKSMKVGESYRVLGFDSDKYTWPRLVKVVREKDGKIGWIVTKAIQKRECLLPLFPNTRKEMIESILRNELIAGMNVDDIFLATNIPVYEDLKPFLGEGYSVWENGLVKKMVFYNGELCFNNTDFKMRFYYIPQIKYRLSSVECSDSIIQKNGVVEGENYKDEILSIGWNAGRNQLSFVMVNNTNASLKLLWDDMAYVKYNKTYRVIHRGIKFSQKEQEQANTVVAKKASYNDVLIPSDYVKYNEISKSWESEDLNVALYVSPNDEKVRKSFEKSSFQILFPVVVNDKRVEYTFTLIAESVEFEQHFGDYFESHKL